MCWNNRGSGLAGGALEENNFRSVGKVLRCFGKRVRVLDVERTIDFVDGRWLGVWSLGSARGTLLGTLVWSRADAHVYVVDSEGMQASTNCDSCRCVGLSLIHI